MTIYPNIRTIHKDLQKSTYDYYESKRLEKIQESRSERRNIIKLFEEENILSNYFLKISILKIQKYIYFIFYKINLL